MNPEPCSVSVVVDHNYGQRLNELFQYGPVWIVESPTNREASQEIWSSSPSRTHLDGVTLFKAMETSSSEEMLVRLMDAIELHHGVYSADPPYIAIRVIGTPVTPALRHLLGTFGIDSFLPTDEGFRAVRPLASALALDDRAAEDSDLPQSRHFGNLPVLEDRVVSPENPFPSRSRQTSLQFDG